MQGQQNMKFKFFVS